MQSADLVGRIRGPYTSKKGWGKVYVVGGERGWRDRFIFGEVY